MPTLRNGARATRIALAAAALVAGAAHAESSPYVLAASLSYTHDSNLLLLGDGGVAPSGFARADDVTAAQLLGGFDKSYGRQHYYGNASVSDTRYRHNSAYDNTGYNAVVGLDWTAAEHLSGSLSLNASRALFAFNVGYGVGFIGARNLQNTQGFNATIAAGLASRWSLVVNAGHRQVGNSLQQANVQALNYWYDNVGIGLRWSPSSATAIGVTLADALAVYPNYYQRSDGSFDRDRYTQPSIDLSLQYQPTAASSLEAHLGYQDTRYDLNAPRNFSGATVHLNWVWQPSYKTRVTTRYSHDTGQNSYSVSVPTIDWTQFQIVNVQGVSAYSQTYDTLRLQGDYQLGAKTGFTAAVQAVNRKLTNLFQSGSNIQPDSSAAGKDQTTTLSVGVRWAPLRSVNLGCDYATMRRSASGSAGLTYPLHDNNVSCFGQFQLQQ